jgi:transcriptional regulator with XRE-family HTH domain
MNAKITSISSSKLEKSPARSEISHRAEGVGRQIRELRHSRGLTLTQLSQLTGRSVGNLSEIERDKCEVTIKTLGDIAQVLDVPINWFFSAPGEVPREEEGLIVRRGARRRINLSQAGTIEELLSPDLTSAVELILTTFEPGGDTGESGRLRKGDEAGYVVSGVLELQVDGHAFRLEPGDSFALKRGGQHWCRNPGEVPTVVVWAISPALY